MDTILLEITLCMPHAYYLTVAWFFVSCYLSRCYSPATLYLYPLLQYFYLWAPLVSLSFRLVASHLTRSLTSILLPCYASFHLYSVASLFSTCMVRSLDCILTLLILPSLT